MSTAEQVPGTAALYFGSADDLLLLKFSTAKLERDGGRVRMEEAQPPAGTPARPGGFPHVYPPKGEAPSLSWKALVDSYCLERGADGKHVFPAGALDPSGCGDGSSSDDDDDDPGMYG